jgi:hypothetical protein
MNANEQQLVHALRTPVIMITIGVLFLLDNLTSLQIGQTWPVLLIVVGIMALGGGTRRSRGNFAPPVPPPGTFPPGTFPPEPFPTSAFDQSFTNPQGFPGTDPRPRGEYRR